MNELKILVTGGAGFIGSHIVNRLVSLGCEVTVFDNFSTGKMANLSDIQNLDRLKILNGDVCDEKAVRLALKGKDAVFHEAGFVSAPLSIKNPLLANKINVEGTLSLLEAACELDVKKFVFASSAAVYGGEYLPFTETVDLVPPTPYGVTKLAAESYVRAYWKLHGLETVALRYFNVYGPKQSLNIQIGYGGVIAFFLERILHNQPPTIFGDGEQTRDFVSVHDVVEANILALTCKNAVGQAFNVGSGVQTSVNQIADALKKSLKRTDLPNVYEPSRHGDLKFTGADISKAKNILGFKPKYTLEKGIEEFVNWHQNTSALTVQLPVA